MSESRWIRVNVDWDDSPWLDVLSAESQLAWIKLLCLVKKEGTGGRVKAKEPAVAAKRWGVGTEHVTKLLRAAQDDGALLIEDGCWVLQNWCKYQDNSAERMRRYRERGRDDEASPLRNVTSPLSRDSDSDIDRDREREKEREVAGAPPRGRFVKPSVEDVAGYLQERGITTFEASGFIDFYESVGWRVGNKPMKDWRAAVRTWETRHKNDPPKNGKAPADLDRKEPKAGLDYDLKVIDDKAVRVLPGTTQRFDESKWRESRGIPA